MAAAAQAVHNYFGGERILYINVVNNLSVDCDCDSHPVAQEMNAWHINLAKTNATYHFFIK